LVAHGDHSIIANCQTNITTTFGGLSEIFLCDSKFLFVHFMIARETPADVLQNPGWAYTVKAI
jgi:hypothetical protein